MKQAWTEKTERKRRRVTFDTKDDVVEIEIRTRSSNRFSRDDLKDRLSHIETELARLNARQKKHESCTIL